MAGIDELLRIMARLRDPERGCPWDLDQDFASISPHTIEEAYEVDEAIARGDLAALCDELGDLLFQVVFQARLGEERGAFDFERVVASVCEKLVRRHPHLFADAPSPGSAAAQVANWEAIKAAERAAARGPAASGPPDPFEGIPRALPALIRAYEMSARASAVGFDWARADDVLDKLDEEVREIREAVGRETPSPAHVEEELGDMLFAVCNLARKLGVEPEAALRKASDKFQARFTAMERLAKDEGRPLPTLALDEQEALWQRVKRAAPHADA